MTGDIVLAGYEIHQQDRTVGQAAQRVACVTEQRNGNGESEVVQCDQRLRFHCTG